MHPEYAHIGKSKDKLIEEIGEVLQAIGKCERFGLESHHPDDPNKVTNLQHLLMELDDLQVRLNEAKNELEDMNNLLIGHIDTIIHKFVESQLGGSRTIYQIKTHIDEIYYNLGMKNKHITYKEVCDNIPMTLECSPRTGRSDPNPHTEVYYIAF